MIALIVFAVFICCALQFVFKHFTIRERPEFANNYHLVRRAQHVLTGFLVLMIIQAFDRPTAQLSSIMGALTIGGISVARFISKQFNVYFIQNFQHIMRPHELNGFPGAFYFITGVACALCFFNNEVAQLGVLLISVGDPSAAIIGIKFSNSPKIWGQKNIAGTFGSAIIYLTIAMIYSYVLDLEIIRMKGIIFNSLIFYFSALITELVPLGQEINKYIRLDDNLFGMILGCIMLNQFY